MILTAGSTSRLFICYKKKVVRLKRFVSSAKRKYFFLENKENTSFMSGRNHGISWLYILPDIKLVFSLFSRTKYFLLAGEINLFNRNYFFL